MFRKFLAIKLSVNIYPQYIFIDCLPDIIKHFVVSRTLITTNIKSLTISIFITQKANNANGEIINMHHIYTIFSIVPCYYRLSCKRSSNKSPMSTIWRNYTIRDSAIPKRYSWADYCIWTPMDRIKIAKDSFTRVLT